MFKIIPQAQAAIDLGQPIEGVGPFGTGITNATVQGQFGQLLSTLIGTITIVGGLAFVVFFFLGALKWITAGGDKGKVSEAQSQMTNAAIGLIALTASFFIIGIVGGILGLNILNPIDTLIKLTTAPHGP